MCPRVCVLVVHRSGECVCVCGCHVCHSISAVQRQRDDIRTPVWYANELAEALIQIAMTNIARV